jgi:hypothetical protein
LARLLAKTQNRLAISAILGVITAVVDYFVYEGMSGPEATEAIVTGLRQFNHALPKAPKFSVGTCWMSR